MELIQLEGWFDLFEFWIELMNRFFCWKFDLWIFNHLYCLIRWIYYFQFILETDPFQLVLC
jgi:hypothetical protein